MKYRLIITDIDGTLLNDEKQITAEVTATLSALRQRGVQLVLSTARPPQTIRPLYDELGLDGPVIAHNGALIYHPLQGRKLAHHPIDRDVAIALLATIRELDPNINVSVCLEEEWHFDRIDQRLRTLLDGGVLATPPRTGEVSQAVAHSPLGVSKLYFVAPEGVRQALTQRLNERGLSEHLMITSSGVGFVEILAAGVHKGSALRAVAAILGIPVAATVALGDEENDIPALKTAGLSIAMGNAGEHVKQAARFVTGPNTQNGWAEAIERHVLAV